VGRRARAGRRSGVKRVFFSKRKKENGGEIIKENNVN
jgi:hypothetical protein